MFGFSRIHARYRSDPSVGNGYIPLPTSTIKYSSWWSFLAGAVPVARSSFTLLSVQRHHERGEGGVGNAADDERLPCARKSESYRVGLYRGEAVGKVPDVKIDINVLAGERRVDRIRHLAHVRALRGRGEYLFLRIDVEADVLVVPREHTRLA